MIVEGLVKAIRGVVSLFFDMLGHAAAPAWFTSTAGKLQSLVDVAASMGTFVPWSVLGGASAAVIGSLVVSLLVRVARILISAFTGGGGTGS